MKSKCAKIQVSQVLMGAVLLFSYAFTPLFASKAKPGKPVDQHNDDAKAAIAHYEKGHSPAKKLLGSKEKKAVNKSKKATNPAKKAALKSTPAPHKFEGNHRPVERQEMVIKKEAKQGRGAVKVAATAKKIQPRFKKIGNRKSIKSQQRKPMRRRPVRVRTNQHSKTPAHSMAKKQPAAHKAAPKKAGAKKLPLPNAKKAGVKKTNEHKAMPPAKAMSASVKKIEAKKTNEKAAKKSVKRVLAPKTKVVNRRGSIMRKPATPAKKAVIQAKAAPVKNEHKTIDDAHETDHSMKK